MIDAARLRGFSAAATEVRFRALMTDAGGNTSPNASRRPRTADVTAELQRVLASRCFEQADRAKEFLRYVVAETLAGRGERLKGYTIGLEVFRRPASFDAHSDPLVRVEAGRVRRRLTEYYAGEGARNPVRIELTRGGYVPQFNFAHPGIRLPHDAAEPMAAAGAPRRRLPLVAAAATIVVVVAGLALWRAVGPAATPSAPAERAAAAATTTGPPKVLVLPFANLGDGHEYFAHGITEELTVRLAEFDVRVVVWPRSALDPGAPDGVPPVAGVDYVLAGTVRNAADRVSLGVRLLAADTRTPLWHESFDEPAGLDTLFAFQERIAARVAAAVTRPLGPIFRQEVARAKRATPEHLDTYDCVLKLRYYRHTFAAADHGPATDCFRSAIVREPSLADAWAGLGLLYVDEHLYGYSATDSPVPALERASEAARRALEIDADSRLASFALAKVRYHEGDRAGFEGAAERLLATTPRFADHLITIGTLLVVLGDAERGLVLVEEAMAFYTPDRPPGLYFVAHALDALARGDYDRAVEHALRIDAAEWPMGSMILAASAGLAGQRETAQRAVQHLLELSPDFPRHARSHLEKWHPHETLLARVLEGLEAAGVAIP
jgi:TolB-like protein